MDVTRYFLLYRRGIFEDYKKVIDGTEYYFRGLRGQMNDDLDSLRVKLAKERGE